MYSANPYPTKSTRGVPVGVARPAPFYSRVIPGRQDSFFTCTRCLIVLLAALVLIGLAVGAYFIHDASHKEKPPRNPCDGKHDCAQICTPTQTGYQCDCEIGYQLNRTDRTSCNDINECLEKPRCEGTLESTCLNTPGSYRCGCAPGYKMHTNGFTCIDVDECTESGEVNGGCQDLCVNHVGGYHCECHEVGFELSNNAKICKDLDECVLGTDKCQHSSCFNTHGSYKCVCQPGYVLDEAGVNCVEEGETCDDNGGCSQICVVRQGTKLCQCYQGFRLADDGYTCDVINVCPTGQEYNELSQRCEDVDECAYQACSPAGTATCINTYGSYYCQCPTGYNAIGDICFDTDECLQNVCQPVGVVQCQNTEGSYRCICPSIGWLQDGSQCRDINECDMSPCSPPGVGVCANNEGSYTCTCPPGWTQSGDTCLDIDECSTECIGAAYSICSNTQGSFSCSCAQGYEPDANSQSCTDIDECARGIDQCDDKEGTCQNTQGSYTCSCPAPDWRLAADGFACEDFRCNGIEGADFVEQVGICYLGSSTGLSYTEAQSFCQGAGAGGRLIHVKDATTQGFVEKFITDNAAALAGAGLWLGLSDQVTEGTFVWDDGTALGYANWAASEPNFSSPGCVQIKSVSDFTWEDINCSTKSFALCEFNP